MLLRRVPLIALLLLSLGGSVALADPNLQTGYESLVAQNQPNQPRRNRDRDGWMDKLNLSAEQRQQIQSIRDRNKDQFQQRQQALRQQMQELRDLMAGNGSTDQIRQKHQQIQSARQELDNLRFENMLAIRDVLTVDQRRQMAEMMQQKRGKMRNRGGDNMGINQG